MVAGPVEITRLDDTWQIGGRPLSALSRDELEQLAGDLIEDNTALDREVGRLAGQVSAGFDYRVWRAKPPEQRKAGAQQHLPGTTE